MADNLKPIPISSLPAADLESTDQIVAYRDTDGMAYRGPVGQIGSTNLSDAFDSTKDYSAGDYCIYSDTLYKFTADHSGRWTGDDVEATLVGTELTELNTNLTGIIKAKRYELPEITIPGSSTYIYELNISSGTYAISGYTAIGALGFRTSSSAALVYRCEVYDGSFFFALRNINTSTSTTLDGACVTIVYMRNSFVS